MRRIVIFTGLFFVAACGSDATTSGAPATSGTGGSGQSGTGQSGTGGSATVGSNSGGSTVGSSTGGSAAGGGGGVPGEVRLLAIGDVGEGNEAQHCVADAMSAKCAADGCDAVLLNGDNFYDTGVKTVDDAQWVSKFEEPYDRMHLNGLKFYAVLGNHDYAPPPFDQFIGSDGSKQAQIDYTNLPVGVGPGTRLSDKWTMPSSYYSQAFGDGLVEIFALDTQDCSTTQQNAMQAKIGASSAQWKLSFAHHPRYTSGDHNKDNFLIDIATKFPGPSMYELQQSIYCGTDIFMSGHDHNREFMDKGQDSSCPNTHFIISGAGAKTRSSSQPVQPASIYYDEATEGFMYLIFKAGEIVVESYDVPEGQCVAAGTAQPAFSKSITK